MVLHATVLAMQLWLPCKTTYDMGRPLWPNSERHHISEDLTLVIKLQWSRKSSLTLVSSLFDKVSDDC